MGNAVTTVGYSELLNRIQTGDVLTPLYIAWGTGFSDPLPSDTDLSAEDTTPGYARDNAVLTLIDGVYRVSGHLDALADLTIKEWGIFNGGDQLLFRETRSSGWIVVEDEGLLNLSIRATASDSGLLDVRSGVGGVLKLGKESGWPYYCPPTDLSCVPTASVTLDTRPSALVECA